MKLIGSVDCTDDIQTSLGNHWLFYLKQLLTQSLMPSHTNTELLRSVTISHLGKD